jgi:PKD repeat protein
MRLVTKKTFFYFLVFGSLTLAINISCNKDHDLFLDTILNDEVLDVEEAPEQAIRDSTSNSTPEDTFDGVVEEPNEQTPVALENRTTAFPTINDAYIQNGLGFDLPLVRLQENYRTSYLMFDLSQIDSIAGTVISAELEFTINEDSGDGIIEVFKGSSNNWTENTLSSNSAPDNDKLLGTIEKQYVLNSKIQIDLNADEILPEYITLVLVQKEGDDLAFASQENPNYFGPKLNVVYETSVSAKELVIVDEQEITEIQEENTEQDSEEQESTEQEETTEQEATEEEESTEEEEETEEEAIEEESTEEETEDEESTEEETTTESVNEPPIAVATANVTSGNAPLTVNFIGGNSTDDKGIVSYYWNYPDDPSAAPNNTRTFNTPGIYRITLTVKDAEGLSDSEILSIEVNAPENSAPIAVVNANVTSGNAPLLVDFIGENSSDDKEIVAHSWNFDNGSTAETANTTHTFTEAGNYDVVLTVTDAEGLSDTETITIVVNTPINNVNTAPIAVASANVTSGNAPLTVNFVGGNSTDDKGIVSYYWNYPDDPSAAPNNTRTFNNAGVYQITLTVSDAEGLVDTDTLTITVNENISDTTPSQIQCIEGGGKANQKGSKIWCWNNTQLPAYNGKTTIFSNGQLGIDSECNENQITNVGDQLRFYLNPETPDPQGWCNNAFNMRAEIYTAPWRVNNPLGTEEWMGWSYTFGNNYQADNENPWLFFQIHQGVSGSPPVELAVVPSRLYGAQNGEVVVINYANRTESDRTRTGVVPQAGTTLDIVVNVVHGLGSNGLLRVWINGNKVYDKQVGTVHSYAPWGGNAKFGIYNWSWRDEAAVQKSLQQGIDYLETFMGPLRMITRYPGDADYGKNSYIEVAPD